MQVISEYQSLLGYPDKEHRDRDSRDYFLALIAEAIEALDTTNWKPWKRYKDEPSRAHLAEELADIFFFLNGLRAMWDITPAQLEQAIIDKVRENMRRINAGYNHQR